MIEYDKVFIVVFGMNNRYVIFDFKIVIVLKEVFFLFCVRFLKVFFFLIINRLFMVFFVLLIVIKNICKYF